MFDYDVLIIGGGPAGLSAGLSLGRMSARVLIVDDNRPRNAPSSHANNFPTRDGIHPAKWREHAREDLKKYSTVELRSDSITAVCAMKSGLPNVDKSEGNSDKSQTSGFSTELLSGANFTVRSVLLAYGITDVMPEIEGFKELWGKLIYHCPFCHGYEVKNQTLALFGFSPMVFHSLPLIASLSSDIVFMNNGKVDLDDDQRAQLKKYGVAIDTRRIKGVERSQHEKLLIHLEDGTSLERDGAFAALALPVTPKSSFGEQLGCQKTEFGFYKVNERGETSVPGVLAAGDCASMMHSVLGAAASGSLAGAMLSFETWKRD